MLGFASARVKSFLTHFLPGIYRIPGRESKCPSQSPAGIKELGMPVCGLILRKPFLLGLLVGLLDSSVGLLVAGMNALLLIFSRR